MVSFNHKTEEDLPLRIKERWLQQSKRDVTGTNGKKSGLDGVNEWVL